MEGVRCSCEQALEWPRQVSDCTCEMAGCSAIPLDIQMATARSSRLNFPIPARSAALVAGVALAATAGPAPAEEAGVE